MKLESEIVVINKLGLHARAATKLVKLCNHYSSQILFTKESQQADGKSIMSLLMLAAKQGTELKLVVEGEDAEKAMESVTNLFNNYFDEGE